MQDQGNQIEENDNISKKEFDTMSLLLEFKDKSTDSQRKMNQTLEKKIIMELQTMKNE